MGKKKKPETTGKRVSRLASEAMRDEKASKRERSLAASALTQAPDRRKVRRGKRARS